MATNAPTKSSMEVHVRWRPISQSEAASGELPRDTTLKDGHLSISLPKTGNNREWKSPPAFASVFDRDNNGAVYKSIVAPDISDVMQGGTCNYFAYGHSGSGKTHTIIGYDFDNDSTSLGLCLAAARQLFESIGPLNADDSTAQLGIGFSLFELRRKKAYDLLNNRTECHIREGPDGKTHIRGETEMLPGGKVRVRPIVKQPCWSLESLKQELITALGHRAVGSSSVHDQSSRTHAVLEFEIINQALVDARQAVVERQSELVPVGKRATDISIEEQSKGYMTTADGIWVPNPEYTINQARIDAANAEKAEYEACVTAAEEEVTKILASSPSPCLGGKMVFVDLAGAEYHQEKGVQLSVPKQTPQERQEGQQINTDLLALKEVIRAWAENKPRIPFRNSALTMVLRENFRSGGRSKSAMIVTVSPAVEQYAATLNSLKYGSLVGAASR
ncbi:hypothetical protein OQA88_13379 [Cercophora sp. LCS_1]